MRKQHERRGEKERKKKKERKREREKKISAVDNSLRLAHELVGGGILTGAQEVAAVLPFVARVVDLSLVQAGRLYNQQ